MSLLKLSPASDRLRRLTRAYAAGEISTGAYRTIRAQVVVEFAAGEDSAVGDDTQPRFAHRLRAQSSDCHESQLAERDHHTLWVVLAVTLGLFVVSSLAWLLP